MIKLQCHPLTLNTLSFFFQDVLNFDLFGGQNVITDIQAQLKGTYFWGQFKPIKVTILANTVCAMEFQAFSPKSWQSS